MKTKLVSAAEPDAIEQAVQRLQAGELVAFPTDTVYGLGALAQNIQGIQQLYEVKGRESAKAIPILISDMAEIFQVAARVDERALRLAQYFWPGPLTLLVPRHPSIPDILTPYPTVGVRVPDHPIALALLRRTGPLATTSANLSNRPSATTADEVLNQLSGRIPFILDGGKTPGGVSSTVVDCSETELKILRQGPITMDMLLKALS